jgi:hypothetical protein
MHSTAMDTGRELASAASLRACTEELLRLVHELQAEFPDFIGDQNRPSPQHGQTPAQLSYPSKILSIAETRALMRPGPRRNPLNASSTQLKLSCPSKILFVVETCMPGMPKPGTHRNVTAAQAPATSSPPAQSDSSPLGLTPSSPPAQLDDSPLATVPPSRAQ